MAKIYSSLVEMRSSLGCSAYRKTIRTRRSSKMFYDRRSAPEWMAGDTVPMVLVLPLGDNAPGLDALVLNQIADAYFAGRYLLIIADRAATVLHAMDHLQQEMQGRMTDAP